MLSPPLHVSATPALFRKSHLPNISKRRGFFQKKMEQMNTHTMKSSAAILPPFTTITDAIGPAPASGTNGLRMLARTRLPHPKSICHVDLLTTAFSNLLLKLTQHYSETLALHQIDASAPREQPETTCNDQVTGSTGQFCNPNQQAMPMPYSKGFAHSPTKSLFHKLKSHPTHCTPKHKEAQQITESPVLIPSFSHSAASVLPAAGEFGISGGWQTNFKSLITH